MCIGIEKVLSGILGGAGGQQGPQGQQGGGGLLEGLLGGITGQSQGGQQNCAPDGSQTQQAFNQGREVGRAFQNGVNAGQNDVINSGNRGGYGNGNDFNAHGAGGYGRGNGGGNDFNAHGAGGYGRGNDFNAHGAGGNRACNGQGGQNTDRLIDKLAHDADRHGENSKDVARDKSQLRNALQDGGQSGYGVGGHGSHGGGQLEKLVDMVENMLSQLGGGESGGSLAGFGSQNGGFSGVGSQGNFGGNVQGAAAAFSISASGGNFG